MAEDIAEPGDRTAGGRDARASRAARAPGVDESATSSQTTRSWKPVIASWNQLSQNEARFLLKIMREESGDGPAYRATLIARLAVELFGPDWDAVLRERLMQRFRVASPESLAPNEAHAEIEELLSRIARRDGLDIETVRRRFFGKPVAAASSPSPSESGATLRQTQGPERSRGGRQESEKAEGA